MPPRSDHPAQRARYPKYVALGFARVFWWLVVLRIAVAVIYDAARDPSHRTGQASSADGRETMPKTRGREEKSR